MGRSSRTVIALLQNCFIALPVAVDSAL